MKKWNELPLDMQVEEVKKYYKILEKHTGGLFLSGLSGDFGRSEEHTCWNELPLDMQ